MKYVVTHSTKYAYSDAVPVCHNVLHLEPRQLSHQKCIDFGMLIHPEPFDLHKQIDSFGNPTTYMSIEQAHLGLIITSTSTIELQKRAEAHSAVTWEGIVDLLKLDCSAPVLDASIYAFPSQRTKASPGIAEFCARSFPCGRSLFDAVTDLTSRIYEEFEYDPTATNVTTPIEEVFAKRRGVCQDFAHLQLACLRSLGLAARYISGYLRTDPPPGSVPLEGSDESHAWISVFFGDQWIDFDPTNNLIPSLDHITVGWGRDYSDVCPIRGVILGGGTRQLSVAVDVVEQT